MHEKFMREALELAAQGLGRTSPNPCVGALVVSGGRVVGRGFHAKAGKPHAEVLALRDAGCEARGADLYVTLEPCCHFGRTGPCVAAIIKAGVSRVVCAMKDPNPIVNGKGFEALREAGVEVVYGVLEDEAALLNQIYLKNVRSGVPYVALKTACTLDFKIANAAGRSKWITGKVARRYSRKLRSHYDAILTGIGTVLADDPMLSARTRPLRVILDSKGRVPRDAKVLRDDNYLVYDGCDLKKLLNDLWNRGVRSVFVEAGNKVNTSFVKADLVDKFYFFIAPKIFEGGLNAFDAPVPEFDVVLEKDLGKDFMLECYRRA